MHEVVFVAFPAEGVRVVVHAFDRCCHISFRFLHEEGRGLTLGIVQVTKGFDELRLLRRPFGLLGSDGLRVDGAQTGCC